MRTIEPLSPIEAPSTPERPADEKPTVPTSPAVPRPSLSAVYPTATTGLGAEANAPSSAGEGTNNLPPAKEGPMLRQKASGTPMGLLFLSLLSAAYILLSYMAIKGVVRPSITLHVLLLAQLGAILWLFTLTNTARVVAIVVMVYILLTSSVSMFSVRKAQEFGRKTAAAQQVEMQRLKDRPGQSARDEQVIATIETLLDKNRKQLDDAVMYGYARNAVGITLSAGTILYLLLPRSRSYFTK